MTVSDDISDTEGMVGDEGGVGVEGLEEGGGSEGTEGVSGVILGRKAELISPIPTKKSSTNGRQIYAHISAGTLDCQPTWYDLNQIRRPLPDVSSVVNYHHHRRVTRKKSL